MYYKTTVSLNCIVHMLQEMFITELMKGAHKTSLECCHKEISYGHLGELLNLVK